MPRLSGHRLPQCELRVNGRRCMRAGRGTPPLCKQCRAAVENAARVKAAAMQQARTPGSALGDLIGDFFADRPFDPSKVGQVLTDIGWGLGGIFGGGGGFSEPLEDMPSGYAPPNTEDGWQARQREQERRHHEHQERQQAARPQVDPAIAAARRELGFGPSDRLTEEVIKDRRRELSRKYHPDLAQNESKRRAFTVRMGAINNAADVLVESLRPTVTAR